MQAPRRDAYHVALFFARLRNPPLASGLLRGVRARQPWGLPTDGWLEADFHAALLRLAQAVAHGGKCPFALVPDDDGSWLYAVQH